MINEPTRRCALGGLPTPLASPHKVLSKSLIFPGKIGVQNGCSRSDQRASSQGALYQRVILSATKCCRMKQFGNHFATLLTELIGR